MNKKSFFILSEIILFFAIAIITLFAYFNGQTTYRDYIITSKKISTDSLKDVLELSLSFGKTYTKNTPFTSLLNTNISPIAEEINLKTIVFTDENNNILYSENIVKDFSGIIRKEANSVYLPKEFFESRKENEIIEHNNLYWLETKLFLNPLNKSLNTPSKYIGSYFTAYNPTDFNIDFINYLKTYSLPISLILILGTVCLLALTFKVSPNKEKEVSNTKSKRFLFLITICCQVSLSSVLLYGTYNFFLSATYINLTNLTAIESEQIERLLNLGLPIEKYASASDYYTKELIKYNTVQSFKVFDENNNKILDISLDNEGTQHKAVSYNLLSQLGENIGRVETTLSAKEANYYTLISAITLVTIFIISFLAATEAILFFTLPKINKNDNINSLKDPLLPVRYIRVAVSVFTFSTTLALSFLPIKMLELTENSNFGINPIFASSLPSTAEFACCLISLLFVNKVSKKYGWQSSFILGASLYSAASILSAFSPNPLVFIFARALSGFAYGFAWLSPQAFTLSLVPPEKRALSFALTTAGIYSGYIAGVSSGAILAVEISYEFTFLIAALFSLTAIGILLFTMKPFFIKPKHILDSDNLTQKASISITKYLFNRSVFSATFLVLIPFSLVQIGLLNFAIPITFKEEGFTPILIGASIMLYGLIQVYIAPNLTLYFQRINNKKSIIFIGFFITFIALCITNISPYSLFISVILIGIAGACIGPSQSTLVANLPITQELGIAKSIGIQRFSDKLGQSLGPFIYGILFTTFPYSISLTISGIIFLMCGLLFLLLCKNSSYEKYK